MTIRKLLTLTVCTALLGCSTTRSKRSRFPDDRIRQPAFGAYGDHSGGRRHG
ncbi:MAG: hypothetical protein ACLRSE_02175 [Alistipes finegoldii]